MHRTTATRITALTVLILHLQRCAHWRPLPMSPAELDVAARPVFLRKVKKIEVFGTVRVTGDSAFGERHGAREIRLEEGWMAGDSVGGIWQSPPAEVRYWLASAGTIRVAFGLAEPSWVDGTSVRRASDGRHPNPDGFPCCSSVARVLE